MKYISARFSKNYWACFSLEDAAYLWEGGLIDAQQAVIYKKQVHGIQGGWVDSESRSGEEADWLATSEAGLGVGVFVADCTAILLRGTTSVGKPFVAALHAGWRGTAKGIIQSCLETIRPSGALSVWLSPSICARHYPVSEEVISAFGGDASAYVTEKSSRGLHFDLKGLQIEKIRKEYSLSEVFSSSLCTYEQPEFFSYRQEGGKLKARHFAWLFL